MQLKRAEAEKLLNEILALVKGKLNNENYQLFLRSNPGQRTLQLKEKLSEFSRIERIGFINDAEAILKGNRFLFLGEKGLFALLKDYLFQQLRIVDANFFAELKVKFNKLKELLDSIIAMYEGQGYHVQRILKRAA